MFPLIINPTFTNTQRRKRNISAIRYMDKILGNKRNKKGRANRMARSNVSVADGYICGGFPQETNSLKLEGEREREKFVSAASQQRATPRFPSRRNSATRKFSPHRDRADRAAIHHRQPPSKRSAITGGGGVGRGREGRKRACFLRRALRRSQRGKAD